MVIFLLDLSAAFDPADLDIFLQRVGVCVSAGLKGQRWAGSDHADQMDSSLFVFRMFSSSYRRASRRHLSLSLSFHLETFISMSMMLR